MDNLEIVSAPVLPYSISPHELGEAFVGGVGGSWVPNVRNSLELDPSPPLTDLPSYAPTMRVCLLVWVFFLGEITLARPLCNIPLGAKRFASAPGGHAVVENLLTANDCTHISGAKLLEISVL